MHKAPFHRRILPWVFAIVFLAIAPVVVFYTAGYRYNPKKGFIERNGTIIVDTEPRDVSIYLNGIQQEERSPAALQYISPGTYAIRLSKDGYHDWEKTLQIRPDRVTFVSEIDLWKQTKPNLVIDGSISALTASPNERFLAGIRHAATSTEVVIYHVTNQEIITTIPLDLDHGSEPLKLIWNDSSQAFYVQDASMQVQLISLDNPSDVTILDAGIYRWDGDTLMGLFEGERLLFDIDTGVLTRQTLPDGITDIFQDWEMIASNSEHNQTLVNEKEEIVYELPPGQWTYWGERERFSIFTFNQQWLYVSLDQDGIATSFVSDDEPARIRKEGETHLLALSHGEIWTSELGQDPELLLRKSNSIKGAVWHRRGMNIFYATEKQVIALELDPRDGREETVLANLLSINHFASAQRALYIAGRTEDQEGVFLLEIE